MTAHRWSWWLACCLALPVAIRAAAAASDVDMTGDKTDGENVFEQIMTDRILQTHPARQDRDGGWARYWDSLRQLETPGVARRLQGAPENSHETESYLSAQDRAPATNSSADPHTRYNSLNKTRPAYGDVFDMEVLRSALANRTYEGELIIMVGEMALVEDIGEMLFSQIMRLQELGYGHYIVLMNSKAACDEVRRWSPEMPCVWNSLYDQPGLKGNKNVKLFQVETLWLLRWMLFLKAVQLGYNPLVLDLDVWITQDMYQYLKHPALAQYNFIPLAEGNPPKQITLNGGCVYAQGAYPDGPTAWIVSQVAERTMRWLESPEFLNPNSNNSQPVAFEQAILNDALMSACVGRPTFHHSFLPTGEQQRRGTSLARWDKAHNRLAKPVVHTEHVAAPPEWQQHMHFAEGKMALKSCELRLPDTQGTWPDELGGKAFPDSIQEASRVAMDYIAAGGVPLFPHPESRRDPRGKRQARVETALQAPAFLFSRFPEHGRRGSWQLHPRRFVGAHFVAIPGGNMLQENKKFAMRLHGWWKWEANALLHGESRLYRVARARGPDVKVLAFPRRCALMSASREEARDMVMMFIRIASLAGRVPAWPAMDCNSSWIQSYRDSKSPLHGVADHSIIVGLHGGHWQCHWMRLLNHNCHSAGFPAPDFDHWVSHLPQRDGADYQPNRRTLLLADTLQERLAARNLLPASSQLDDVVDFVNTQPYNSSRADMDLVIPDTELLQRLKEKDDEPVVYLASLVSVQGDLSEEAWKSWGNKCSSLWDSKQF